MTRVKALFSVSAALTAALAVAAGASSLEQSTPSGGDVNRALSIIRQRPIQSLQHDYVMSARIRLLVFWKTSEDVGGGYIRTGSNADRSSRSIQVLFGSDPKKAPRSINRWGSATETIDGNGTSTTFGFMKSSKGANAAEMEKELASEKEDGKYFFDAILGEVHGGHSVARVANFVSPVDFDFNEYDKASAEAVTRLQALRKEPRELKLEKKTCAESRSFLFAVEELGRAAVDGKRAPIKTCYVYNSRAYTITLKDVSKVSKHDVKVNLRSRQTLQREYTGLVQADYQVRNQETGDLSSFEVLFGTSNDLRGVPVQIRHQPNWWFQIVLDLL
jgi:hypothetical protein